MAQGTHWRKAINKDSPHLTVWDIEGHSPLQVTIEATSYKKVHSMKGGAGEDAEEDMLFLRFKGAKKELGIKTSNSCIIAAVVGTPYIEQWLGKKITLRTAECRGEPCIRVDAPAMFKFPKLVPRFRYTDSPKPATVAPSDPLPKGATPIEQLPI